MTGKLAVLSLAVVVGAEARAQGLATVDIPYQKFVLDNGLTLIVHEDHKAPDRGRERLVPRRLQEREARARPASPTSSST